MLYDFIPMLLIAAVMGLIVLAAFFYWGFGAPEGKKWSPAFALAGLTNFLPGLYLLLTWPIPKFAQFNPTYANLIFGTLTVFFGAILMNLALAVAMDWKLHALAVASLPVSLLSILVGVQFSHLGITNSPVLSSLGFLVSGVAGVLAIPLVAMPNRKNLRLAVALLFLAAAAIWAAIGYLAFWIDIAKLSS